MNHPVALVYTSHTGFTAQYAKLLSNSANLPAYDLSQSKAILSPGSSVLYLGWLCAGKIKGLSKAQKRYDVRAICAVGLTQASFMDISKLALDNRCPSLPLFYLQGGYARQKLRGLYRPMMKAMEKMVTKAPAETEQQQAMQAAFVQGGDWVCAESLTPVLDWLLGPSSR